MNKDINSVAVLGSGTMGAGIAALAADNNCKVLLLDISEDVVKKGKERIVTVSYTHLTLPTIFRV